MWKGSPLALWRPLWLAVESAERSRRIFAFEAAAQSYNQAHSGKSEKEEDAPAEAAAAIGKPATKRSALHASARTERRNAAEATPESGPWRLTLDMQLGVKSGGQVLVGPFIGGG